MREGPTAWWSGPLSEQHAAMVASIDDLCAEHVTTERCAQWDAEERFPAEAMAALAGHGWAGLPVSPEWGGEGASARDLVVVHEALARRSLAVAQSYYSLWVLGAESISRLGTDAQRQRWLPRLAAGEATVAFALTEPDAGSDAAALRTRAMADGDGFVVSGEKVFITGAAVADVLVTAVRTGEDRHRGITLLLIDRNAPGVSVRPMAKIGLRAVDLSEVRFDEVTVPATDVLGTVDGAWSDLRPGLARERLYLAAISVGALFDVLGLALDHARNRWAFGRRIGDHQMVAAKLARLRVAADAGASLVWQAAALVDAGAEGAAAAASVAKLFCTEAYVSGAHEGTQILGGYGFVDGTPMARHYRDCKYLEIGGGTSEIQTIVIARAMGLSP